jgi:paraquat-inducible protein A
MLLMVAVISPLLDFRLTGQERSTGLAGLPIGFEDHDMPLLAIVVLGTTMLAPFLRLLLTVLVIGGLRGALSRPTLVFMAKFRDVLKPWAMIEVFLLGMFVAYTRLAALATVTVGIGIYALGALIVLTAWADCWLDDDAMWAAIDRRGRRNPVELPSGRLIGCDSCGQVARSRPGEHCPRCDTPLRERRPQAIARTWALLITAAILYVPANLYPVMTVIRLGRGAPSTIIGGVRELIEYRMWPLALLVFVASILVPMLKLLGLATLLITTQIGSARRLTDRTRLYRLVDFVGRWSMIDVFMLAILTALVQMGALATVQPGYGAVAFATVVVLTMLAALSFDPRLMWDAAEQPRPVRKRRLRADAVQA